MVPSLANNFVLGGLCQWRAEGVGEAVRLLGQHAGQDGLRCPTSDAEGEILHFTG